MESTATIALYDQQVLKDGDTFLVSNRYGDIDEGSHGLFHHDTRLLSVYRLRLGETWPALLSAAVTEDNVFFVAHLTNRKLPPLGGQSTQKGLVHICRSRFLCHDRMFERISCRNYGNTTILVSLRIELDADFRDMFEVRGNVRPARGETLVPEQRAAGVVFRYIGLDRVMRSSVVEFSRAPQTCHDGTLDFPLELEPGGMDDLFIEVGETGFGAPSQIRYRSAAAHALRRMRKSKRRGAKVVSNGPLFNNWMERSRADLALLTSELATGPYPYAGIPWFSTPFGRDAVVTALQTLWLNPGLARGVLSFLARHQAQEASSFLDSAPGKIMHETRKGEMSATRELPFGLYYGGVDTTPLFVLLAGAYARRTGDLAFIDELWPALLAATAWIERVCDANPMGLLDYERGESSGLSNQGWKDSEDSVFHADGSFPDGPIALVEVQGYAFAAFRAMFRLARRRNDNVAAEHWQARAEALRMAVEQRFWMPQHGYYGIALDGEGALCQVRASNPGHLLYVGLVSEARAAQVSRQLLGAAFHTGWGVRTLAKGEANYNPMSYHNGSVWPHDSALCAAGIARYGDRAGVERLLRGAFEAAVHFDMRLPELFCGFRRGAGSPPIAYPVACLPQAWAAGSPFMLLQSCLGVDVDGWRGEVNVNHPRMPRGIDEVHLHDFEIRGQKLDLVFRRVGSRVGVFTDSRKGPEVPVTLRD